MKPILITLFFLITIVFTTSCNKKTTDTLVTKNHKENTIQYAKGLEIDHYSGYSILKVTHPWPNTTQQYTYILQQKGSIIPDSLHEFPIIPVPISSIIVTSTTHIPSLELLGVEKTLVGFPNTNYISSKKTRIWIDSGHVQEIGHDQSINTEVVIDLAPTVLIGHGINNQNPTLENLEKNGLKILFNGDWNETTPLGKAEWIKFFGALYNLNHKADSIFSKIATVYLDAVTLAKKATTNPTVLSGAMYQDHWYLPEGNSWASLFIKEAHGHYLWESTPGTGSLSLSFESVFDKAQHADFWIGTAHFTSLKEMEESNIHYKYFNAFKNKNIYSSSTKKGVKGGILYYELAPNRPDLVLKDLIKILHPGLLPNHKLFFFKKLE